MTISREKTGLRTEEKSFRRGKIEWGNLTVFREPIKHNKICPKKGTKQSRNIVGIKINDVTFFYSSSKDIADICRAGLPDSRIAHNMSCGPTRLSFLICFGIAPFFKQQLLAGLKKAPCFMISFDESFNQELQKEQMDFIVRYLCKKKVVSRYLT